MPKRQKKDIPVTPEDIDVFTGVYRDEIETLMGSVSSTLSNFELFKLRKTYYQFAKETKDLGRKIHEDQTIIIPWIRRISSYKKITISKSFHLASEVFIFATRILEDDFDELSDFQLLQNSRNVLDLSKM